MLEDTQAFYAVALSLPSSQCHKIAEVGSAACFSGPQYTIPQLCYHSAQSAITQCFQICQCAMRNAAIADTSAMHNHSKKKIKLQNKSQLFKVVCVRARPSPPPVHVL